MYYYPYEIGIVSFKGRGYKEVPGSHHAKEEIEKDLECEVLMVNSVQIWKTDIGDKFDSFKLGDRVRITWQKIDGWERKVVDIENVTTLMSNNLVKNIIDLLKLWTMNLTETRPFIKEVIEENREAVKQYRSGDKKVINLLVGKLMKKARNADAKKSIGEIKTFLDSNEEEYTT